MLIERPERLAPRAGPKGTRLPADEVRVELARRLRAETAGEVLFDSASRGRYATDASIYQIVPAGVFVPANDGDVANAIAIARELGVAVLPRGAGTSQCGQTTGAALVIDATKHLRRVVAVDVERRTATVEPGLVLDALNASLKKTGLWFPVDVSTSAQATIGGMAGNNSCGSRSIAYGNMVHNVLGIRARMADGAEVDFGPVAALGGRALEIAGFVRGLAARHRAEIEAHWPKVLRRVAGYNLDIFDPQSEKPYTDDGSVNLAHLLVGSEGTLAWSRELTLKLAPLPAAKVLGVVNFRTFRAAMEAAEHIVPLGPTAVELVDRTMIDLALANPAFRSTMETALRGEPAAILLVEFAGEDVDQAPLVARLAALGELMGDLGAPGSVVEMVDEAAQKRLWEVRKAGLNIMMSLKGDGKPVSFIEDCAVPLAHLADYTDALTEVFARHGTRGTWYAHASVGTLHVRPILDMRRDGAAKMRAIAEEASVLVRKYKGAFSGEHGDGLCRGEWIAWQFGPALDAAFRAIKDELDPTGLFNPGKIIDPPRMDDAALFRFPPPSAPAPYRTISLTPALDWSAWDVQNDARTETIGAPGSGGDSTGGFAKAVEMCNNNGHCRKFDAGTMCPSYRVTRDEEHVTRGRANTLRLALSGQLAGQARHRGADRAAPFPDPSLREGGEEDWLDDVASKAVLDALDLCVSCKGCKRECPTGVDMARMKIEFLAQHAKRHGRSLKERLIARLPDYGHALSAIAPVANALSNLPGAGAMRERLLGFAADRPLPRWRRDTFWRSRESAGSAGADATLAAARTNGKAAVLFVDTFTGLFESENALAAMRVLRAAGYTLHTVTKARGHHCCGRTFLTTGRVDEARARAGALLDALLPFADAGVAIVGLEPSCLLTLRDETLALRLGKKAETVARHAWLFEEFVAREAAAGRFHIDFTRADAPMLVHAHCHQKAFGAAQPILDVLRLVPDAAPTLVESSCCGMAGSFGYEARHQEVSLRMAEASLLPAIRARPEAIVVADGTSCRQQIAHGAAREAVHAARVLDRFLPPDSARRSPLPRPGEGEEVGA
jgi:FAD/FMN-containing dehydrogenase/Fe-S oxidoreductase